MKHAKMLRAISLLLAMSFIMLFAGCGGDEGEEQMPGGNLMQSDLKVALITSAAGANDKGYNESAVNGLERVKNELGIETKVTESSDIPQSLAQLAESGYQLIFSLEYDFDALIKGVGGAEPLAKQYPDTTFVIFNDNPNLNADGTPIHKNVVSVLFDVHEASFLSGVLSTYVIENANTLFSPDEYAFTTGENGRKVGFIGGTKSNGITVFGYGFAEGVNYAAQELGVKYTYYSDYNAGFVDSAAGANRANSFYSNGANVVFSCAGAVGDGVTSKAKEVKKLAIEVDADKDANQPGYILTSVMKNTEVPVFEIVKAMRDGKIGDYQGRGVSYDLKSGATGITDLSVIESKIMESGRAKWEEIKQKVSEVSDKISNGEIKVTNAQAGEVFDKAALKNLDMPND